MQPSEYPYDLGLSYYDTNLQMLSFSICDSLSESASADLTYWLRAGLVWTYNFHHEEALQCFLRALSIDETAAMAHWGASYANGPNYNAPSMNRDTFPSAADAYYHATEAKRLASLLSVREHMSDLEIALIDALQTRFNPLSYYLEDEVVLKQNTSAYAAEMKRLYEIYKHIPCVGCLYAEALMNFHPWKLWVLDTGEPAELTLEIKSVLEASLVLAPNHPGLNHFYIHLMEMSSTPEAALPSCKSLRNICPDAGKQSQGFC